MATKKLVKAGLRGLKASQLVDKSIFVEGMMTGNLNFATPVPTIASITAARTSLTTALGAAVSGAHADIAVKNDAENTLHELLVQLSRYINSASNGDVDVAVSSGFELVKTSDPVDQLDAPDVSARQSAYIGAVDLRWKRVHGARMYNIYMTTGDPSLSTGWTLVGPVSRTKHTISDLVSGEFCNFRVSALGKIGEGPVSKPIGCRAA